MSKLIALDERVGKDISDLTDFDDVMNATGFGFSTEQVNPLTPEGEEIKNKWIVRRTDNKHILGFVGGRYTSVGNDKMLEPFHRLVNTYNAKYETAGMIEGGKKCWISAILPDGFKLKNRPEDEIQQRVMALFAHDGTKRNAYFSIAHRIFCNNQLSLICNEAAKSNYTVSHTKNWEQQWIQAQLGFENAIALHKEFEDVANMLDDVPMTVSEMRGFTTAVLPKNEYYTRKAIGKEDDRRKTNRLNNRREEVVNLFINGAGNRGISRWDALNAVTEYVDHHNQIKKLDHKDRGFRNAEKRFVSNVLGGSGDSIKQRARSLLVQTRVFDRINEFVIN